jgi:hypothetical protein
MPQVGFEPTISTGERPQTYALELSVTGIDKVTKSAIVKSEDRLYLVVLKNCNFYKTSSVPYNIIKHDAIENAFEIAI